jgi:hypothetical protein
MKNNTDEFQQGQFPPHGRVEMHLSGKTILLRACGPFNIELVSALASLEADFLSRHAAQGPFAEIVIFSGSVLASPEVLAAHAQLLVMLKQAGLAHIATAYVIPKDLEGEPFTAPVAKENYAALDWPYQQFQNFEDAQSWINEMLAGHAVTLIPLA